VKAKKPKNQNKKKIAIPPPPRPCGQMAGSWRKRGRPRYPASGIRRN